MLRAMPPSEGGLGRERGPGPSFQALRYIGEVGWSREAARGGWVAKEVRRTCQSESVHGWQRKSGARGDLSVCMYLLACARACVPVLRVRVSVRVRGFVSGALILLPPAGGKRRESPPPQTTSDEYVSLPSSYEDPVPPVANSDDKPFACCPLPPSAPLIPLLCTSVLTSQPSGSSLAARQNGEGKEEQKRGTLGVSKGAEHTGPDTPAASLLGPRCILCVL